MAEHTVRDQIWVILSLMTIIKNDNHGNVLDRLVIGPIFCYNVIVVCFIVRITSATTCEETTVWIAIFSSTAGYILPSPNL